MEQLPFLPAGSARYRDEEVAEFPGGYRPALAPFNQVTTPGKTGIRWLSVETSGNTLHWRSVAH